MADDLETAALESDKLDELPFIQSSWIAAKVINKPELDSQRARALPVNWLQCDEITQCEVQTRHRFEATQTNEPGINLDLDISYSESDVDRIVRAIIAETDERWRQHFDVSQDECERSLSRQLETAINGLAEHIIEVKRQRGDDVQEAVDELCAQARATRQSDILVEQVERLTSTFLSRLSGEVIVNIDVHPDDIEAVRALLTAQTEAGDSAFSLNISANEEIAPGTLVCRAGSSWFEIEN